MRLYILRVLTQLTVLTTVILAAVGLLDLARFLPWLSRFSPLMTFTQRICERQWTPYFTGGVLVAFTCLIFPRIFCGWLCPLGTCIDITDRATLASKRTFLVPTTYKVAVFIFLALLAASIFGYNVAGFADPLTITGNTGQAVNSALHPGDRTAYATGYHAYTSVMPIVFLAILSLTIFGRRTWCRTLCPLGGLLSLLGVSALHKRTVADGCIKCGKCKKSCKMDAVKDDYASTTHQSCISCRTCMKTCPKKIITLE